MIIRKIVQQVATKRVAAYARVSTLTEAQEESYETQVSYYKSLIEATEGWEMVDVYADHGITGTSAAKRPGFMRMIEDAKAGKIDIILCKSISRFSRNFVEAQKYVHELKAINVEVRFEKDGVSTFNTSSDFIFGAIAAVSQEESRSISENVKWAYRRLAEQGIRHVGSNHMLGYDEIHGKLTPNGDAWIVKLIFEDFVEGMSPTAILTDLREKGAHRLRSQKDFTWSAALRILHNEAYVGDRLLQKDHPQNYKTKKPDPSEPYESKYLTDDHEGIVPREVWEAAQERLKKQEEFAAQGIRLQHTSHFLYGHVYCAECGQPYKRCTARNQTGLYKTWRCKGRVKGECGCRHIRETELLREIADLMGTEELDEEIFTETVEKVLVSKDGVEIVPVHNMSNEEQKTA